MKIGQFLMLFLLFCSNASGQFSTLDILQGRKSIDIPFEYIQGFIIIEVRLNNLLPLHFLFDTGAENTILFSTEYAYFMGLEATDTIKLIGADKEEVQVGRIIRRVPLKLYEGGSFVTDIVAIDDRKLDFKNLVGRDIDGIIGGNVLLGAIVEINYKSGKLTFHDPSKFRAPKKYHVDTIEVINQRPFITTSLSISGEKTIDDLKFLFDSGAGIHILVDEASHPELAMPDSISEGRIGYGLGGQVGGYLGNAERISMLDDEFYNVKVYYQEEEEDVISKYLHNHRNGILGNVYWERKRIILDYSKQLIYTKNYKRKHQKFRFNLSGLVVFAVGPEFQQFLIKGVVPNSPAYDAGLRSGDVITSFNGYPSSLLSLDYINKKLSSRPNKKIRIKVKRAHEKISTSFILRELELKKRVK